MREGGLGRVTMRRLAAELDTGPASLYVYVQNMAELHGAILDELLAGLRLPDPDAGDRWHSELIEVMYAYTGLLFEHPSLARSVLTLRPSGPNYLRLIRHRRCQARRHYRSLGSFQVWRPMTRWLTAPPFGVGGGKPMDVRFVRSLTSPPMPNASHTQAGQPSARSMPIRRLGAEDLPACLRLSQDRDWLPEEHKWRLLFEVGAVYGIDDPEGGLAGTVVATRYGRAVAAISMMLVARRHERQGLGGRLMRHALAEAGTTTVWLTATDYGRPLYERLGFRTIGRCHTYGGPFRPPGGGSPRPVSRPMTAVDLPEVLALDLAAFGADRTALLTRLPSFSEEFRVVDGPSGVAGFGGAWRNGDGAVLGPVIAQDSGTALALISDLAAAVEGPLRLDADDRWPELATWAEAHGLSHRFTTAIMVHGAPLPGDRDHLFTPVMVALG
ncbi:GNAT family N-acetyltransferase [Planotetraspora sp. A-T 1434]|uniref:GNAT family N-acetyltransferase n=1 Tax=Planotetraspora sp. A-T 1434 TaxID=2979219 RepID=UPI0021C1CF90|nr:GNAT family N-acetyltransferase [Planotetraspora sp. A-T 1434]MCT9930411.1 GNAT family N-acetyltransferase [Planotetraspora sp. A-T 1434]